MNPNSLNQRWSKWVWFVVPGRVMFRPFSGVIQECARFGRKAFGAATQMRVRKNQRGYIIEILTEGHPVHDPQFQDYMRSAWQVFFENGFGLGTISKMTAKLMAGSPQNGKPCEQMIIMPFASLLEVN